MPMVSFHLEPSHIPWTLYKSKSSFQTTMSDIMIFDDFARHKNLQKTLPLFWKSHFENKRERKKKRNTVPSGFCLAIYCTSGVLDKKDMVILDFFSKAVKNEVSLCLNCQFFSEPEIFEALHIGFKFNSLIF